jgi:hypothetical protein
MTVLNIHVPDAMPYEIGDEIWQESLTGGGRPPPGLPPPGSGRRSSRAGPILVILCCFGIRAAQNGSLTFVSAATPTD